MKAFLLTLGLPLVLGGCVHAPPEPSSPSTRGPEQSAGATSDAAAPPKDVSERNGLEEKAPAPIWERFVNAWNGGDQAQLSKFRASSGLVALDNPGALVRIRLLGGAAGLSALEGESDLARLKQVRLNPKLEPGDAPKPSCEDDSPTPGTFVTPSDRFRLDVRFRALGEYELASKEEIARLEGPVKAALQNDRFAVYDLEANVGFLFGEEGGHVVLLAIDAVIPCSA